MKKIIIVLAAIAFSASASLAQQLPMFGSYNFNKMLLTPSASGMDQNLGAGLSSRLQFAGFEGAPISNIITMDYGQEDKNYGIGLSVFSDRLGLINNTGVQASYAYRVQLSEEMQLGLGLGLGFNQWRFDTYNMRVEDITDPNLFGVNEKTNSFRADFGAHFKYKNLFVSAAVPRVYASDLSYGSDSINTTVDISQLRHIMGFASYKIDLADEKWALTPSVLLRTANEVQPQIDVNLLLDYVNKAYLIAGWRQDYAASIGAGFIVNERARIGYAYDFPINNLNAYKTGSHELTVIYRFSERSSDMSFDTDADM